MADFFFENPAARLSYIQNTKRNNSEGEIQNFIYYFEFFPL